MSVNHPRTVLRHLPPAFWWGAVLILVMHLAGWRLSQPGLPGALALVLLLALGARLAQRWQQRRAQIEQCQQDVQQLKQTHQSKNELLATVSHELRTPLNVLMGLHPFIQEATQNDAQAQRVLHHMHVATQELLQACQTILELSQPQPQPQPKPKPQTQTQTRTQTHASAQQPFFTPSPTEAMVATTERPWRFLVVDDNPLNVLVLRLMLEKKFPLTQVVCVNGAAAAMHHLSHEAVPDVMLLDVMMPGIDGYALARWVRQHAQPAVARLPMVAITGAVRAEDAALRERCGINDVVYKPLDPQQLCVRLCGVLRSASNRGDA